MKNRQNSEQALHANTVTNHIKIIRVYGDTQKKCTIVENSDDKPSIKNNILVKKEQIIMLFKQNSELVKNGTVTTNSYETNINSNNTTFNLQFFLNDTCKDTFDIMDFVKAIQLQLSDLKKKDKIIEDIAKVVVIDKSTALN
jgi:hypothetical protein